RPSSFHRLTFLLELVAVLSCFVSGVAVHPKIDSRDRGFDAFAGAFHYYFLPLENPLRSFEKFTVSCQQDSVLREQSRNERSVGFVPSLDPLSVSFVDRFPRYGERRRWRRALAFVFRFRSNRKTTPSAEDRNQK